MQIVTRTVGRQCVVGLVVGVLAVAVTGCGREQVEPASLQEIPPEKNSSSQETTDDDEPTPPEEPDDSGSPVQELMINCTTVNLPIPEDWVGQETGSGTWTFGAPELTGELTIDGEYREGVDAVQDIRQLTAQLGGANAETKTYGKDGIVIVGDDVETGTEWRLGMVVGEANQIVNLGFEYDTSGKRTDELVAAENDVAKMALNASLTSPGTCEGL